MSSQAFVRPDQVPSLHPGGLLPVQGLPAGPRRRRGEPAAPQHSGLRPVNHPEEDGLLRGRPSLLHRGLRLCRGGLHLRAAAGEGAEPAQREPEPGEDGAESQTQGRAASRNQDLKERNNVDRPL